MKKIIEIEKQVFREAIKRMEMMRTKPHITCKWCGYEFLIEEARPMFPNIEEADECYCPYCNKANKPEF